jgi:hypothetical protein
MLAYGSPEVLHPSPTQGNQTRPLGCARTAYRFDVQMPTIPQVTATRNVAGLAELGLRSGHLLKHKQTHTDTHGHTRTHTDTHGHTKTHTDTHGHTHTHTRMHKHRHTYSMGQQSERQTGRQSNIIVPPEAEGSPAISSRLFAGMLAKLDSAA